MGLCIRSESGSVQFDSVRFMRLAVKGGEVRAYLKSRVKGGKDMYHLFLRRAVNGRREGIIICGGVVEYNICVKA